MSLKSVYSKVEAEKKNAISSAPEMSRSDFISEHKKLIKILKSGSRAEQIAEAEAQQEELDEFLGTKEEKNEPMDAEDVDNAKS